MFIGMPIGLTGSAPPAAWDPSAFGASLVAWWDPTVGVTKDSSTNKVSSWTSRVAQPSGTAVSLSNVMVGYQPLFEAGGLGGRDCMTLDGTRFLYGQFATGTFPTAMDITIVSVAHPTSIVGNGIIDISPNATGNTGSMLMFFTYLFMRQFNPQLQALSNTNVSASFKVWGGTGSVASRSVFVNGVNVATQTSTLTNPAAMKDIYWGGLYGGGYNFVGKMADTLIFNRPLTDAEMAKIYTWASNRWTGL